MSRGRAVLLLVVAWGVLFIPPLLRGHTFPARDAGATFIPWRAEAHRQLAAGHLPLWNPLANGGRPLLANPIAQIAYPPSWLLLPFGPERSLAASLALHHLLFILGCFAFAERAGTRPGGAAVAAAAVAFSGVPLSATLHANLHASLAWGPWALVTALDCAGRPAWGRAARGGGICLGLAFLGGEPITAGLTAVAWAAAVAALAPRRAAPALLVAGATAIGVAAPLLLPLLACYPDTVRAALGVSAAAVAADALAPRRWLELLLPHLLGDFHAASAPAFWAAPSFPWLRYFPALFLGLFPVPLATRAGISRRTAPWWGLALAGLGSAFLLSLPGVALHLAGQHARFAIKLLLLTVLALPPLLALGWEQLAATPRAAQRRLAFGAGLALFPLLLAATAPAAVARPLLARLYPASAEQLAQLPPAWVSRHLLLDTAALALPFAALAVAPGAPLVVGGAAAASGIAATWGLLVSQPSAPWASPPETAADLPPGTRLAALAAAAAPDDSPGGPLAPYWAMRAALLPNYPNRWGLGTVLERGPDGLESARHELLAAAVATLPLPQRVRAAAGLGAQVAITAEPLVDLSGVQRAGVWRWHLPGAQQLYLARRLHPAHGPLATAVALAAEGFRPGWDAVVEGEGGVEDLPGGDWQELPGAPHRRIFRVQAPGRTLLVVQQSYFRAWRAEVDGRPARVVPVNGAMMGIWVPAGAHLVHLALDPTPYRLGFLGPLLVLLACALTRLEGARRGRGAPSGGAVRSSPATPPAR